MSASAPDGDPDLLDRADRALGRAEAVTLVGILAVMIGLATTQLVLRKLFSSGFEWADVVIRQMVLWVGFIGGAHATHLGRHIAIDALGRLLPVRRAALVRTFSALAAAAMSALLSVVAFGYVREERGPFFSSLFTADSQLDGIESLPFDAIMPVAFVAITFHFVVAARNHALVAAGRREPPPVEEGVA